MRVREGGLGGKMRETVDLAQRRVLVVEDEALICMMIEDMLAGFGCEVVGPAGALAQALVLAGEAEIDVAILDVNLGGKPSFPVADTLQARGIPFIFASGYGAGGLGPHSGAPVLTKPFLESELEQMIRRALAADGCPG